jgi:hypothetical protein
LVTPTQQQQQQQQQLSIFLSEEHKFFKCIDSNGEKLFFMFETPGADAINISGLLV